MTDVTAFASAIYSLLDTAATVNVYYALAPQGTTPPYIIFQRQAAIDEYTFTSGGVSSDYAVKVVSNRVWPAEAMNIYNHAHSIMQDGTASISGFTLLRNRRVSTFDYRDPEGFWHVGGVYRFDGWGTA